MRVINLKIENFRGVKSADLMLEAEFGDTVGLSIPADGSRSHTKPPRYFAVAELADLGFPVTFTHVPFLHFEQARNTLPLWGSA